MRLICPSCGAQYEVPPEAIPPTGRDVQCSACGHTWFERPATPEPLPGQEPWDEVPRVSDDEEEADDLAEVLAERPHEPPPNLVQSAPRRTVAPDVAEILRAEAAREAQARAEEAAKRAIPVTDRPGTTDLWLPNAPEEGKKPAAAATDQPAPRPGRSPGDDLWLPGAKEALLAPSPEPPPKPEPMREAERPARPGRKPELDLDQINASLRSSADRLGAKAPRIEPARRRGGFGRGFAGALIVVALLAGLYLAAPRIIAAAPEAAPVLNPYVAAVDGARLWLDQRISDFLTARLPEEAAPTE